MKILCLLFLLVAFAATKMFTFYRHTDPAAKCLDGTQAGFYYQKGLPNKFLVYFQGGGMCFGFTKQDSIKDCYERSLTYLGSSAKYAKQRSFDNVSYLSTSHHNPFRHYTRIFFPYCDGSLHQGMIRKPIKYNGKDLYFRGSNITIAHFKVLDQKFKIFCADQLILTGTSAGGIASFIWSNYVYERAKKPKGVLVVPDSATFIFDFKNALGLTLYDFTISTFNLVLQQIKMPLTDCAKHYGSAQVSCFQSGNAVPFIKPRVFFLQAQYDSWNILNILMLTCVPNKNPTSLQACNAAEKASIQQYRAKINEDMTNVVKYKKNGVWSISCSQHGFLQDMDSFDSPLYRIPTTTGTEITEALLKFKHGTKRIFIDKVNWPNNVGCNALPKPTPTSSTSKSHTELKNQWHLHLART